MGRKLGALPPFWRGGWVPIEHKVAWAEAYLHTKWHHSPSCRLANGHNGHWPKIGCLCPFRGGGAGSPSNTMSRRNEAYLRTKWHLDPSNRLDTIHQRCRQDRTDRQQTDSIGRTVLQTVAQKPPYNYKSIGERLMHVAAWYHSSQLNKL